MKNENIFNGSLNVITSASAQGFKVVDEKVAKTLTGFKSVKATGGKVNFKVAEQILLGGFQSLAVRKGFATFGDEAIIKFASNEVEVLESDFLTVYKIDTMQLKAIVKRYLKAVGNADLMISERQAIEVIKSVCESVSEVAINNEKASEAAYAEAEAEAEVFNSKVREVAEATSAKLLASRPTNV